VKKQPIIDLADSFMGVWPT